MTRKSFPHCWSFVITMVSQWAPWRLKSPASWLFAQLFDQVQIKENIRLRVTGLCEGNTPMIGGFPSLRVSNTKNVSISWRHHVCMWSMGSRIKASVGWAYMYMAVPHNASWYFEKQLYFFKANNHKIARVWLSTTESVIRRWLVLPPAATRSCITVHHLTKSRDSARHHNDVIMRAMTSQIICLTIV